MKKFWIWLLSWFGFSPTKIPEEIMDETTAWVPPEEFVPENNIIGDFLTDEEVIEILDEEETIIVEDDIEIREPSKFAVLIGINKYDPSLNADLNGCVNDVENMYEVLTKTYAFPHDNIRVLTDYRATGEAMFERMEWLLSHEVPGDELVLHYSGHGSQIRDREGDELKDYMDEILCPTDLDWDRPFIDDDISWLFNKKADGVFLTFICDSCHSGSMTRATTTFSGPEEKPDLPRFIQPPLDIKFRETDGLPINRIASINKEDEDTTTVMDHVLISGCRDDQTSADAFIDGKWQGAMTASLIKAIKNNPYRDWTAIHADVISILNENSYTQRPQLNGDDIYIKGRTIFGS
jgi:metacaspase-1